MADMVPHPPRLILGREFGKALVDAGLIRGPIGSIRRIVIDVQGNEEPLTAYVEYYADERWLDIVPQATGITVVTKR